MKTRWSLVVVTAALMLVALSRVASAQNRRMVRGGGVGLPYQVSDTAGNQWMIYQGGWVQTQGNQPVFNQGGMFLINGQQANMRNNTAKLDEKTGELTIENMPVSGFTVTRRILIDKDNSYVRYVDIVHNPQAQEATANITIQSNATFGIDAGQSIPDPRHKDNTIGFTAANGNGRAFVSMYAGKGSKVVPNISFQQGNNMVQAAMQVPVPAGKDVAIVHIHGIVNSTDQGIQFVQQFKESKLLAALPAEVRKIVINFPRSQGFIEDRELLRGDTFDVVEIRTGDQMRGTLKEPSYKLNTFYGEVDLPASRVIGLINVGDFRPRQLLVTVDGEIFGGRLAKQTIDLELSTGQLTQIPLSQISRVGYRKQPNEPEEWTFDKPFITLRTGERVDVAMPSEPIDVVTRYGTLKLDPKAVATIAFQNEDNGVHEVYLTDGSKFAGLVGVPEFDMKLSGGSTTQPSGGSMPDTTVKFPTSAIARLQLSGPPVDVDADHSPTLTLSNGDQLVGSLAGQLKLDTAFDTIAIDGNQVRKLTRSKDSALDVQVTLWDASILSGQLEDPTLACQLESGIALTVPVALLEDYNQPQPQPSAGAIDKIKAAVAQLNADDWKARDHAQADLTALGPAVVGVLKKMRGGQPPEAQQRIDQILETVGKKK